MSQLQQSQLSAVMDRANNCIYWLRYLRSAMLKLQETLTNTPMPEPGDEDKWGDYIKKCQDENDDIQKFYNNIEMIVTGLPDKMPQQEQLNRMRNIFMEEMTDEHQANAVEDMVNTQNWNEGSFQFFNYATELIRLYPISNRRKGSALEPRSPTISKYDEKTSAHYMFERAFQQCQHDLIQKKAGIWPTVLEMSPFGSVIELKFGCIVDKATVITQKMLFVENNGTIELVLFVAPHEEWTYNEDYGEKKIDVTARSRHEIYRKLTAQANITLQVLLQSVERWTLFMMRELLQVFSRYQSIFETPCRSCKKVMKDCLPCLVIDPRQASNRAVGPLHESCR